MNNTITTVIIDDQPECIEVLEKDLSAFPDLRVAATASTADRAWKAIVRQQPDLLFLDVELAGESGLELLNDIRPAIHSDMHVVFYSAFDKYMLDALRASAFDFLLKPYQYEELAAIIERAREKIRTGHAETEQASRWLPSPHERKFAMQTITGLLILRKSDILYFQYAPLNRSWQMMLTDGSVHRLRLSIKGQEILNISPSFIQISQDIILNADYLIYIENKTLRCVLSPPHSHIDIKASKRYYSKIKETLEII